MIIGNGTEIQSVIYKGVDLDRVIYNGVVVFEKNQSSNIEAELIDFTYFKHKGSYILTGWKGTYQGEPSENCIVPNYGNIKLHLSEKVIIESAKNKDKYTAMNSQQIKLDFVLYNFKEEDLENLKITLSKINIVKYNSYTYQKKDENTINLTVILEAFNLGSENIAITLSIKEIQSMFNFDIEVLELLPSTWTVEEVEGCYPFILNENGFYESNNKGLGDTIAMCKVNIVNPLGLNVYIDCIQDSDSSGDYGMLSKINTPLSTDIYAWEGSDLLQYKFQYENVYLSVVDYGPVEGYVYIKYKKNATSDSGTDSFQFRIRIE